MLEREESTTVSVSSEITTANTASVVLSLKSAEFSNSQDEKPPGPADPSVAGTEQKNVHRARLVVVAVLLLALAVVSTTVHQLIRTGEKGDFESEFARLAIETITAATRNSENTIHALEGYSATFSSYSKATDSPWPFVTISDWSARAKSLTELTHSTNVRMLVHVEEAERERWDNYTQAMTPVWYQEAIDYEGLNATVESFMVGQGEVESLEEDSGRHTKVNDNIFERYLVNWQSYPLANNWEYTCVDFLRNKHIGNAFNTAAATSQATLAFLPHGNTVRSEIIQPIFEEVDNGQQQTTTVGAIWVDIDWVSFFGNILTEETHSIVVVLQNSCSSEDAVSYRIEGPNVTFHGKGARFDDDYKDMSISGTIFKVKDGSAETSSEGLCSIIVTVYPTKKLKDSLYAAFKAIGYTIGVVVIFLFTSAVLIGYDIYVLRRQKKVMARVRAQDKIVASVFPTAIRDRLYGAQKGLDDHSLTFNGLDPYDIENPDLLDAPPLAELFPSVTVVFADIAGFTAWSSAREPPQVFLLLESIYGAFDKLAHTHGVFKVETVGDCYVAVAGIPDPRDDHAVAAAMFARDILGKMKTLTRKLEVTLGPDTADLDLRIGMNSGQVTAGVLRGERSRFQLFGDTVNTAARMESTSKRNHIQLSTVTANLLRRDGRAKWVRLRQDRVECKGKGKMQTYWLETKADSRSRMRNLRPLPTQKFISGFSSSEIGTEMAPIAEIEDCKINIEEPIEGPLDDDDISVDNDASLTKQQRLVEWNTKVLIALLQAIGAAREQEGNENSGITALAQEEVKIGTTGTVLEEFVPIVELKRFAAEDLEKRRNPNMIELGPAVKRQLRDYITTIAGMYRNNQFHNFEHASHVTASVRKLLSRIVSVDNANGLHRPKNMDEMNLEDLAGHSYGITSDPLTQFAVVFSAIIHDVDHPGVPNTQLVKENTRNAQIYKKSVAEQNSVDLAWGLLMSNEYRDLRASIYSDEEELERFRQLVVNTVMATDICDKELQALRKARWEAAFSEIESLENIEYDEDRKATIVIEHLIQASDVSHTMQHWHIYKQWNEKFFMEMYSAYRAGRADNDPSLNWYKGEIGFFDFYVIPLAKKLQSCGVFGVSSHEYLNYAMANREEWERDGEQIVKEYLQKFEANEGILVEQHLIEDLYPSSDNDDLDSDDGLDNAGLSLKALGLGGVARDLRGSNHGPEMVEEEGEEE